MNKELNNEVKEWIESNCPYEYGFPDYGHWEEGAQDMAEHLLSQPPSRKWVKRVLDHLYWCCDNYAPTDAAKKQHIDYILRHWNEI